MRPLGQKPTPLCSNRFRFLAPAWRSCRGGDGDANQGLRHKPARTCLGPGRDTNLRAAQGTRRFLLGDLRLESRVKSMACPISAIHSKRMRLCTSCGTSTTSSRLRWGNITVLMPARPIAQHSRAGTTRGVCWIVCCTTGSARPSNRTGPIACAAATAGPLAASAHFALC